MIIHRIPRWFTVLTAVTVLCLSPLTAQTDFHVSPSGNDSNDGSSSHPWRTFQKACNAATPGSNVFLHGGIYNEKVTVNVSGTPGAGYISFQPFPGESVIVDGTGIPGDQLILVTNKRYLVFKGLTLRNNLNQSFGSGIWLHGYGDHIEIRNLTIHDMRALSGGGDAMAISVYGEHASIPLSNIIIDSNTIYDCEPGHSETIAINGNVDTFSVTNNTLTHVDNIGIVMIGGEATCPTPALDAARNGLCSGNRVTDARSGYGGGYAAGIYVDGGRNIIVERNIVTQCDLGIEIGCENTGCIASGMIVRNNLLYNNDKAGLGFGGYNYPATGKVTTSWFINNTCVGNDRLMTEAGELWIQRAEQCTVRNSIFSAGSQNRLLSSTVGNELGNSIDYNLWYAPGGPAASTVDYNGNVYGSFGDYQSGTGQDSHSSFANPLFVNEAFPDPDLHLQTASPARDAGDPDVHPQSGPVDFDGHARVLNGRIDIGSFEQIVAVPGPPSAPVFLEAHGIVDGAEVRWARSPEADVVGYRIYADTIPAPAGVRDSTSSAIDTTALLTGLLNEREYYLRITAVDMEGNESPFSSERSCTPTIFTELPDAPVLVGAQRGIDSLHAILRWRRSDGTATYRCEVSDDPGFGTAVMADSGLTDTVATFHLPSSGSFYWRVRGRNTLGNGTWSPVWSFSTTGGVVTVEVRDRWNLLSHPYDRETHDPAVMYPTAVSQAFLYTSGGYAAAETLSSGDGFWLKFAGTQEIGLSGIPRSSDTIHLVSGWNLIGSLAVPLPVSKIVSIPGAVATSRFFSYDGAYHAVDTLRPAFGHWVKAESDCDLIFDTAGVEFAADAVRILLEDALPPSPPGGAPGERGMPVAHGAFALLANYPNPFNPTTVIGYSLPVDGFVTLKVYNLLGQEVVTLLDGPVPAGRGEVVWDASGFPGGVYYYRLSHGSGAEQRRMVLVK